MHAIYPYTEDRRYLKNGTYLYLIRRHKEDFEKATSREDFARNLWLMDAKDQPIWRVYSDYDAEGFHFSRVSMQDNSYIAYRLKNMGFAAERTFFINMETGYAVLDRREEHNGTALGEGSWANGEIRIYLSENEYLIRDHGLSERKLRNVARMTTAGKEVWRITRPGGDDIVHYADISINDGKFIAFDSSGRSEYFIDVETGVATYYRPMY